MEFDSDWYAAHVGALEEIDSDICIREFQKCGVPLSENLLTYEEKKKLCIGLSCKLLANE